jgi:ankyrin repeat protein
MLAPGQENDLRLFLKISSLIFIIGLLFFCYFTTPWVRPNTLAEAACSNNLVGMLRLLSGGEDPNTIIDDGSETTTVLIRTLEADLCPKLFPFIWVRLLIYYGADVNLSDSSAYTPLMMALSTKDLRSARLLLSHGADPDAVSRKGWSVQELARENGKDFIRLLENHK